MLWSFRKMRPKRKCHTSVTYTVLTFLLIFHSSKPAWCLQHLEDSPVPTGGRGRGGGCMLQTMDLESIYLGNGCKFFSTENLHHQ